MSNRRALAYFALTYPAAVTALGLGLFFTFNLLVLFRWPSRTPCEDVLKLIPVLGLAALVFGQPAIRLGRWAVGTRRIGHLPLWAMLACLLIALPLLAVDCAPTLTDIPLPADLIETCAAVLFASSGLVYACGVWRLWRAPTLRVTRPRRNPTGEADDRS
ncbi:MAG: hypothetical protein AAFY65_00960 [Pseudomonadota bacterium]